MAFFTLGQMIVQLIAKPGNLSQIAPFQCEWWFLDSVWVYGCFMLSPVKKFIEKYND